MLINTTTNETKGKVGLRWEVEGGELRSHLVAGDVVAVVVVTCSLLYHLFVVGCCRIDRSLCLVRLVLVWSSSPLHLVLMPSYASCSSPGLMQSS